MGRCAASGPGARESGGVGVRVVLIVCTLVAIGAGIGFFLRQSQENQRLYQRKAVQICEYGLQRALEEISADPAWRQGFARTDCDGGWYEVQVKNLSEGDTQRVEIESQGHMGTMTRRKKSRLQRSPATGDSLWSQQSVE